MLVLNHAVHVHAASTAS